MEEGEGVAGPSLNALGVEAEVGVDFAQGSEVGEEEGVAGPPLVSQATVGEWWELG